VGFSQSGRKDVIDGSRSSCILFNGMQLRTLDGAC
jgi:hypothetical protein